MRGLSYAALLFHGGSEGGQGDGAFPPSSHCLFRRRHAIHGPGAVKTNLSCLFAFESALPDVLCTQPGLWGQTVTAMDMEEQAGGASHSVSLFRRSRTWDSRACVCADRRASVRSRAPRAKVSANETSLRTEAGSDEAYRDSPWRR